MFYFLWLILAGAGTAELLVGIPAAAVCGWLSAKLLPGHGTGWHPIRLLRLGGRFVRDSVVAGVEISLIASRPNRRLDPGFVTHRTRIPGGAMRGFFNSYNSLTPGTLAVEPEADDVLTFHCLDVGKPVAEDLAANEAALLRAVEPKNPA